MIHHELRLHHPNHKQDIVGHLTSAHWGIGHNESCVLLQADDGHNQTRIKLTPEEALSIAGELIQVARGFYEQQALETGK
jgi:hypothetical protein